MFIVMNKGHFITGDPETCIYLRFLSLGDNAILAQIILCCGGGSIYCRILASLASPTGCQYHPCSCDNQKHPPDIARCPLEDKIAPD